MGSAGFKWSRSGYIQLMNSAGVQAVVADKANAIKSRADAAVGEDGYTQAEPHAIHDATQLRMAKGKLVVTRTEHAKRAQALRKTLTTSIGG